MADRAGLVNAAGRENDRAFRQVLQRCSTEIAALALGVRNLVYDVLPSTVEVVWPTQGSVGWGIGAEEVQRAICLSYAVRPSCHAWLLSRRRSRGSRGAPARYRRQAGGWHAVDAKHEDRDRQGDHSACAAGPHRGSRNG